MFLFNSEKKPCLPFVHIHVQKVDGVFSRGLQAVLNQAVIHLDATLNYNMKAFISLIDERMFGAVFRIILCPMYSQAHLPIKFALGHLEC